MASCPSDHCFFCCLFLLILQSFLHFLPFCVAIMIRSSNRHELLCSRGNLAWSWGFRCTSLDQSVAARCRGLRFLWNHLLFLPFSMSLSCSRLAWLTGVSLSSSSLLAPTRPSPTSSFAFHRPKRTSASVLSCSTGLIRALAVGAQAFGLHSILHVCPRHRTQAFHSPFPLLFTGGDLV